MLICLYNFKKSYDEMQTKQKNGYLCRTFLKTLIQLTMRKLHMIIFAGLAVLAASCGKDPKPAAPMAPVQVQEKLSETAVNVLNELNPDNWKDFGQSALSLMTEINNMKSGNMKDLSKDLQDLFVTKNTDPATQYKTVVTLIKLSLITGDITTEDGAWKYTKSDKPINITMVHDGKTYKAQLESTGESDVALTFMTSTGDTHSSTTKIYVPTKAAIHVTEDNKQFLDLTIYPNIEDKDGILDENDTIGGSISLQIPGYSLNITDLTLTQEEAKGKMEIMHGSTSILYMDGNVDLILQPASKASLPGLIRSMNKAEIKTLSLMGGQAILEANVNVTDLVKVDFKSVATEAEAQAMARALNSTFKVNLRFDNNPTVQSSFIAMVKDNGEDEAESRYTVEPGLHFYDGSDDMLLLDEFFDITQEAWEPMISKASTLLIKFNTYFGDLLKEFKESTK